MPRVDVVAAVRMLAVDRQAEARDEVEHAPDDEQRRCVITLWTAVICGTRHWQHGDEHGHGPIQV